MYKNVFNPFMEFMKPFMKSHGFTKRGNNFYKRHPQGNIGIINFQKDQSGSRFTINVSIYSYVLAESFLRFYDEEEVKKYPSECDGHWRDRISSLIPRQSSEYRNLANSKNIVTFGGKWDGHDAWWKVCDYYDDDADTTELAKELFEEVSPLIAKFAIPAIDQHITDEQLISLWFPCKEYSSETLQYLATFFLASGEEEKLQDVLNRLNEIIQSKPHLTGVKRTYNTFMRERRWVDDAYVQEREREKELYRIQKEKRKEKRKVKQQREQ